MANTYNWKINALDAKIQEGDNSDVIYRRIYSKFDRYDGG
jgi:hypothetical protein